MVASYRQNVHAYPSGGGDYEVATKNLGPSAGVGVASALMVDYVLTVAVSISSGAQYAASAIPALRDHEALFAVGLVMMLTLANLRGVKESGRLFAIPVYLFMFAIGVTAVVGFFRYAAGNLPLAESSGFELIAQPSFDQGLTGAAGAFLIAGPSRLAVLRSQVSRRSATVCQRSRSRSRATRRRPSRSSDSSPPR